MLTGSGPITGSKRLARAALLGAGALFLASTAPAPETVLSSLAATDARVLGLAHRLQTSGRALCPMQDSDPGLSLHHLGQYAEPLRPAARRLWGLGDEVAVMATAPGGPADRAGLRVGDAILVVDNIGVPTTGPVLRRLADTAERLRPRDRGQIHLTIRRGAEKRRVVLTPVLACRSRVQILPSRRARAWADGRLVTVTTALIEFTRSDAELAFVLAHEIAHNALGHKDDGPRRQRELEADALSLRLMRAANYPTSGVPHFVDRLYRGPAGGLFAAIGHLGRRERIQALRRELARP